MFIRIEEDIIPISAEHKRNLKALEQKILDNLPSAAAEKEDIEALHGWLENLVDKERTVVKLRFVGSLSLSLYSELEELLSHFQEILGAVETRMNNLVVIPEDADFIDLGFSGFASRTVERLRSNIEESSPDTITSRDALALLVRLAGREL